MPIQVLEQKTKHISTALYYRIMVDGEAIRAIDATSEEFYGYVYGTLEQFFEEEMKEMEEDKEVVELRYQKTFNLDWSHPENRARAINEFKGMNLARKRCGLQLIDLFV